MTLVRMINSVDEYVAGEEYDLDDELADRFIANGYADGELSHELSETELEELSNGHQEVSV